MTDLRECAAATDSLQSVAAAQCLTAHGFSKFLLVSIVVLVSACAEKVAPLPALNINPERVTVSGLSSGAYMAQQVHLSFSSRIQGAALLAGGPYGCADGDLNRALKLCTQTIAEGLELAPLVEKIEQRAAAGSLDALSHLSADRVLVLRGDQDPIVAESLSAMIVPLYTALNTETRVSLQQLPGQGHNFATMDYGSDCAQSESPYLGKCGFDSAGLIFKELVSAAGEPAPEADGEIVAFDQKAFDDPKHKSLLADTGYVYVPTSCREKSCGLHVVFHGCQQNAEKIGTEFVTHAGYNRWADVADVVVVYPQTRSSLMPLNPKACWDWWGYSGADYDTRQGAQTAWVGRLLDQLGVHAR